ncbi:hypothetical protein FB446DRAFT_706787 [Lentinula raphanica]|nr:hypothetical protein FB446DRAFT_706787 [Lentinula raphanica]
MVAQGLNAQRFILPDSSEPNLRPKLRLPKSSNKDHAIFKSVQTKVLDPKSEPTHGVSPNKLAESYDESQSKASWATLSMQMLWRLWNGHRLTFIITLPLVMLYVVGQYFPSVRMPQELIGTLCTPMGIICSCALPDLFAPLSAINCNADYYHTLCDRHEVESNIDASGITHIVPATTDALDHVPTSAPITSAVATSTTVIQMAHESDVRLNEPDVSLDNLDSEVRPVSLHPLPRHLLPDFGLAGDGAKVVSGLTSPTEGLGSLSYAAGLIAVLRGYDKTQMYINPPLVVLEEQVSVASCWKFTGPRGHITVSLSDTIVWTHFTLHFPDHLDTSDRKVRQAPKILVMRALVLKSQVKVEDLSLLTPWERFVTVDQLLDSSLFNASSAFLDVGRVFYTPTKEGWQTFTTQIPVQTSIVLIEIVDNWGDTSTCIHRISFHSQTDNLLEFGEE